jgi:hypothetical protein
LITHYYTSYIHRHSYLVLYQFRHTCVIFMGSSESHSHRLFETRCSITDHIFNAY